jgi:diadenosine tetraphosphate (Ap4A) HIT family hydrolase
MRNNNCCDIWAECGLADNSLIENDHWTVLVRPKQVTVGSCLLIANRHVRSLAELNDAEARALIDVTAKLERLLKDKLQYDRINYLALMMTNSHVHFHVIPRYEKERKVAGRTWKDDAWPKPPDLGVSVGDAQILSNLRTYLRQ